jgi:hypothetical protein
MSITIPHIEIKDHSSAAWRDGRPTEAGEHASKKKKKKKKKKSQN